MQRLFRLALLACLPAGLVLASGCSKPASTPADTGAAPAATRAQVQQHMDDHFTRVRAVEEAVVGGDVDGARAPARWIAEHQETTGLPAAAAPQVAAMKDAAKAVVSATDLPGAAKGAAALAGACGDCHAALHVKAAMPLAMVGEAKPGTPAHMAEHQYAVDLLYRGLVSPSPSDWTKGAEALARAPLGGKDLPDAKDALAAEKKVHAVADTALHASDRGAQMAAYADVVGSCAHCHGLHGRVWGPGVPKTEAAPEPAK